MKFLKIAAIAALAYVGLVVAFESMIGIFQPEPGGTLVITTFEADGTPRERVVSKLESEGRLYVAANHWPRAWYERALAQPSVRVEMDDHVGDYRAVPVDEAERRRVNSEHPLPVPFRFVTGFPPRHFVRLEPAGAAD